MKHLIKISLFVLYIALSIEVLNAQNINILWFDASLTYTPGAGVSVIINPTDTFTVNNKFTLELSEVGGGWTSATQLKEVNEFYTPVINAVLPSTLAEGRYKMRIRSSNPVRIEEIPSFEVKAGTTPKIPSLLSTLTNNTTYFNCQDINVGGLEFGSLNQQVGATTASMNLAQRIVKINEFINGDDYKISLYDVLNNNQISLTHQGNSISLPDNLALGTYIIQVVHTKSTSSVFGGVFLFHGNGTNLGNTSSEEICVNNSVYFGVDNSISGIGRNYLGSKYEVNFGDGSKVVSFTQKQLLTNPIIAHVFNKASCSEAGSSFSVQIQLFNKGVANSCGAYAKNGTGVKKSINVSVPPTADFKTPVKSCINKSVVFENITIPGFYGKVGCKEASNFYWYYKKPGELDFTLVTETSWVDAKGNLTLPATIVNESGCWSIKIEAQNQDLCQSISNNEKSIMIESVALATFNTSIDSICVDNVVNFTNTSNVLNQSCIAPVFTWIVEPEFSQNSNGYTFLSHLDDASIRFSKPGKYVVKLKIVNACGTVTSLGKNIFVAGGASVVLPTDSLTNCIAKGSSYTIDFSKDDPKPLYNSNYGNINRYNWIISGNNISIDDYKFINNTNAGSAFPVIEFNSAKQYQVAIEVESDCYNAYADTMIVTLNEIPEVDLKENSQTICSGSSFQPILLGTANYRWAYKASRNLSSSATGGNGNTIQAEVFINNSDSIGTVVYSIVPTSGICNGAEFKYKIFVKPSIKATVVSNNAFCLGADDAKLILACKNGFAPYTIVYSINDGEEQQVSSEFASDTISIRVPTTKTGIFNYRILKINDTDLTTCDNELEDTVSVEVVDNPIITTQPVAYQEVCKGAEIDSLTIICAKNSGSQKIQWFKNTVNSNFGGQIIEGANSLTYQPAAFAETGNYYYYCVITLNASNCGMAISDIAQIKVVDDPKITLHKNALQSVCKNATLNALEVQAQGGVGDFAYQWFVSTDTLKSTWTKVEGADAETYIPTSEVASTNFYYCEVSQYSHGCSAISQNFKVEIFDTPVISKQPLSKQICKSEASSKIEVEYAGGSNLVNYQWFKNLIKSTEGGLPIVNATTKNLDLSTDVAGTYYYYCQLTFGTDGCASIVSDVAEITVTQYPILGNQVLEVVSGQMFTMIPVLSDNDFLPIETKYTWTIAPLSANSPLKGMTEQTVPQTTVSDVIENHSDTISSVRYIVTPEVNGCTGTSFSLNVIVLPALKVVVTKQDITCFEDNNGQLEAIISGGLRFTKDVPYRLKWDGPNGFESNNLRLTNLMAGEYLLSVSDSIGTEIINKYIIDQPEKLTITTIKFVEINCSGDNSASIDVNISGGKGKYTYIWTKNDSLYATTDDISALAKGIYMLTVTDENGCESTSNSYEISEYEPILIDVVEQINNTCFGGSNGSIAINVSGGTKIQNSDTGYIYKWTGVNNFSSESKDVFNLQSGDYQLIVIDNNGCTSTLKVNISQPTDISIVPFITPVSCSGKNDATITLEVSGGKAPYEAEWSNFATGFYQQNLSAGSYLIKVTDANRCEKTININVEDNSQFTIQPTVRQISCNGANDGSIKLAIKSIRTGIKLKWLDGSTAGNERNNLAPGVYTVEVSDDGPCVLTNTFVISEPSKLFVTSKILNAFGCDASESGAIELNVVGGSAPYDFLWSNGKKTKDISNLLPGKYFVTVTDSLGCYVTESFELLRHDPLKIDLSSKIAYCNINLKFKEVCTASVNGGLAPYTYNWSSGDFYSTDKSTMETFANQTVALEVVDALGCSATYYFKTNIPEIQIETSVLDCNGQVYKFDIKTPPTVFTNLLYDWNFGDGTSSNVKSPTHIFMKSGDYMVKLVITSNESILNFETTMTVEALPQLKLDREPRFCKNDSVELIVSGAQSYIWNDGTRGNRKVIKNEGNYTVMGLSENGCSSTLAFTAKYYDYQNYSIFTDKNVLTLNDPTLKVWSEDVNLTNYQWEFGDSSNDEGNFVNHTYDINSPITVKVKLNVVNPYGCVETAEKVVWLIMESIPNTFTPNSDGANDRFLKGTKMQIFNSNGIIIYEGTEGWDGTYKGKPVATDTYYYVVYYSTPEGIVNKPGFVFLAK